MKKIQIFFKVSNYPDQFDGPMETLPDYILREIENQIQEEFRLRNHTRWIVGGSQASPPKGIELDENLQPQKRI